LTTYNVYYYHNTFV